MCASWQYATKGGPIKKQAQYHVRHPNHANALSTPHVAPACFESDHLGMLVFPFQPGAPTLAVVLACVRACTHVRARALLRVQALGRPARCEQLGLHLHLRRIAATRHYSTAGQGRRTSRRDSRTPSRLSKACYPARIQLPACRLWARVARA